MIVLNELGVDTEGPVILTAVGFEEEPPAVRVHRRLDQHEPVEASVDFLKVHAGPLAWIRTPRHIIGRAALRTAARNTRGTRLSGSAPATTSSRGTNRRLCPALRRL